MILHIARKGIHALITLYVASIIVFIGVRALPGDPAVTLAGENQDPAVIAAARERLGLDESLPMQYFAWVRTLLSGDLGVSLRSNARVSDLLLATFPVTIQLAALAMVIATVAGVGLGIVAAYWRGRWPERGANLVALAGMSVPNFWMGLLGIILLAVTLGWLPASGYVSPWESPWQALRHLLMPAVVLAVQFMAVLLRQTRSSLIEALESDYVLAARSHGMSEPRVVLNHGMRNSLTVLVTLMAMELGSLLSGAVITEQLFGIPGIGKLTIDAVAQRDYAVVQASVLITVLVFVIVNLLVDVLYGVIDPRVRVDRKS